MAEIIFVHYLLLPYQQSGGSSATIKVFGPEIGRVQSLKIIESGAEHQQSPSPPTLSMRW